jgi:hypothetical protein
MKRPLRISLLVMVALVVIAASIYVLRPLSESPLSKQTITKFKAALSCSTIADRKIDFALNGGLFRVRRQRCDSEQAKRADIPPALGTGGGLIREYLVVTKGFWFTTEIIAGFDCDGECNQVTDAYLGLPILLIESQLSGSGGYSSYCVLGWMGDYVGCWQVQGFPTEANLLKEGLLQPGEMLHEMHPYVTNNRLILEGALAGPSDGNCCPTHGGLVAKYKPMPPGDLVVDSVYRVPQARDRP